MFKLVLIAAGGGVGALLRYALAGWGQKLGSGSFPLGTLIVNVVGCLLIGALTAVFAGPHRVPQEYRIAVMVGVLGAFTTFSTFGAETLALAGAGQLRLAVLNIVLSNGCGLASVWIGYRLTEKWVGV